MNNFFHRNLDSAQLGTEFGKLYLDTQIIPVVDASYASGFDTRELKRFEYLIDQVQDYVNSYDESSSSHEFENMCIFYFDRILTYILDARKVDLLDGYTDKIIDTSILLLSNTYALSPKLKKSLSYMADYIFNNQGVFEISRLSNGMVNSLSDSILHEVLTSLYVNSYLGIESFNNASEWLKLTIPKRMVVLDIKLTSMLNVFESMRDGDALKGTLEQENINLIKSMCVTYLQCAPAEQRHDLDTRFKLMSLLTIIKPVIAYNDKQLHDISDILNTLGTSIYGLKYKSIQDLGNVLGVKQDISFWKDNFQSINIHMDSIALPDQII